MALQIAYVVCLPGAMLNYGLCFAQVLYHSLTGSLRDLANALYLDLNHTIGLSPPAALGMSLAAMASTVLLRIDAIFDVRTAAVCQITYRNA